MTHLGLLTRWATSSNVERSQGRDFIRNSLVPPHHSVLAVKTVSDQLETNGTKLANNECHTHFRLKQNVSPFAINVKNQCEFHLLWEKAKVNLSIKTLAAHTQCREMWSFNGGISLVDFRGFQGLRGWEQRLAGVKGFPSLDIKSLNLRQCQKFKCVAKTQKVRAKLAGGSIRQSIQLLVKKLIINRFKYVKWLDSIEF